ncbi:hypothetical protein HMSSN139_45900 [Paenibacillus sp. HMSSN-139]|nr:hypothetical protein HMSSN139_45900 [Paenibacillus sp. HMSSN-139]
MTDPGSVEYAVGQGILFQINTTGNEFFGNNGEQDNVFSIIDRLTTAMSGTSSSNFDDIAKELSNIDSRTNKMLAVHAETGARTNRVELMESRLYSEEYSLTELQTKTEDADIADLTIKTSVASNIYQASLAAGAKIITPTLVDFIR